MLRQARHSLIMELVNERHFVSLVDLMRLTNSSESTIRADLVYLDAEKKIKRIHGGAESLDEVSLTRELSMETKMDLEVEAKKLIASYASTLVKENSLIYIDAGTSTYYLAEALTVNKLTVVTNSVIVARKLKQKGYTVYITGGEFKLTTDAFIGIMTREVISKFTFDMGFFGCNGIEVSQGITTPDYEEAVVKKTAMEHCRQLYVLADHTKFGVRSAVSFHEFKPNEIITDKIINKSFNKKGIIIAK